MSGYNKDTGIFELTSKKMNYWFRREDVPKDWSISDLFEHFGFEVVKKGSGYWHIKATPEDVWEVLSGQPSDPDRAAHYYR